MATTYLNTWGMPQAAKGIYDVFSVTGSILIACTSSTGILHDEFINDGTSVTGRAFWGDASQVTVIGQSWQSGADPHEVTGICMRLYRSGSPKGTFKAAMYAQSGSYGTSSIGIGAQLVASADFSPSTLGTLSGTNYFFPLSGWTPDANTNYVLTLDGTNLSGNASNSVTLETETVGLATHGGNHARLFNGGWLSTSTEDTVFKIYYASVTGIGRTITNRASFRLMTHRGP